MHAMPSLLSGLSAYFPLHEAGTGSRFDSLGALTLTNTNAAPQVTGVTIAATGFTAASTMRLSTASATPVVMGDIQFSLCAWVWLTSKPAPAFQFVSKDNVTTREYAISWDHGLDRLLFALNASTLVIAAANTFGSPAINTWHFVYACHDSVANQARISINAGAFDTVATTGAATTGAVAFSIGSSSAPSWYVDGRVAEVGLWKRLLTETEIRWLYNSGRGRTYPFTGRAPLPMRGGRGTRRDRTMGE